MRTPLLAIAFTMALAATSAASADDSYPHSACDGLMTQHLDTLRRGQILRDSNAVALPYPVEKAGERFPAGEGVAITKLEGAYACVESIALARGQEVSGWIPARDVWVIPPSYSRRPSRWWIGTWQSGRSKITFRIKDGQLIAEGSSWWQGFGDRHVGDFQGHPFIHGGGLRISDSDAPLGLDENLDGCRLGLIAVGKRMAVEDNNHCGGTNVRFSGIYSRISRRPERL